MENNRVNLRKTFLEYEKPRQLIKCVNNKYTINCYDNSNDIVFIDKKDLPNDNDNFVTHLIVDDMNESQFDVDFNEDTKFDLIEQNEDLLNASHEAELQDKRVHWNDKATKLLLSFYKQKKPLLGSQKFKNKRKLWENISKKINESGYAFTSMQVENRFKTLVRAYKKVHQSENLTARSRKYCLFQEELDSIFLKDVAKLSSVEIQFEQDESNQSFESEDTKQYDNSTNISTDLDHSYQAFKKIDWDDKATYLLLKLYKEKKLLVKTKQFKSKKEMWENIASEISKDNYLFSAAQVENRFKTLLRSYKKVLSSGRTKTCCYLEQLDALFLEEDDVFTEAVADPERMHLKNEVSERLGLDDIEENHEIEIDNDSVDLFEEKKGFITSLGTDDVLQEIQHVLANSEKKAAQRHIEIMNVLKEMNEIQRKRNELFEKYLEVQMRN